MADDACSFRETLASWPGLQLAEQITEGNRNEVWRGSLDGLDVSVRRSRRSMASLAWELDLITELDAAGIRVPSVIDTADGRRSDEGIVVQRWVPGEPPRSDQDWRAIAATLQRLHELLPHREQRPGCLTVLELDASSTSVDADLAQLPADVAKTLLDTFGSFTDAPISVVHGDTAPGNLRIGPDGVVGLLDFDESRVDVCWHDLSNLGVQILDAATHARAERLSNAWEAANAWVVEPDYAKQRLAQLG